MNIQIKPLTFLVVLLSLPAWGQPKVALSSADEALLDSLCLEHMKDNNVPGFAVGIASKGKILYAKGFGVKNLNTKEKITTSSVFHMASISKTFVATAVAQLVAEGKLELDDLVTDHLPYFQLKDPRYKDITVRHLVTHSSGIPDVWDYDWDKPKYDDLALENYVKGLRKKGLKFAPGSEFKYSNTAFEVLGDVLAKASGMSFEDCMRTYILEPTGMWQSTFYQPDVDKALATSPHLKQPALKVSKIYPYNREHAPSSTLNSNVDDMLKYALLYMSHGSFEGRVVFSEASYQLLTTRQRNFSDKHGIGLSWFVGPASWRGDDGIRIEHSGGDRGYRSWLGILPEKQWAMVTMYNMSGKISTSDAIFDAAYEMAKRYD